VNPFNLILKYALKSKKELSITIGFMIIGGIANVIIPRLVESMINGVVPGSTQIFSPTDLLNYFLLAVILQ
jgi:ABC-type multidrug transport system fused ATPase/permease subunit